MSLIISNPDINTLPRLGVMPTKYQLGASKAADSVEPLLILPLPTALESLYDTDAHFVTYHPAPPADPERYGRMRKSILGEIRGMGADLWCDLLVLDWDNPGHQPWTPELLAGFLDHLATLGETFPPATGWTAFYTTRAGARLVYALTRPLPVDVAENKYRWLVAECRRAGLLVDETCDDWTRLFRLPKVVRDDLETWASPYFLYVPQYDNRLNPDVLGSSERRFGAGAVRYAPVPQFDRPQPTPEQVEGLLEIYKPDTRRIVKTDWAHRARTRLKGRECYACLFDGVLLAEPGQRDRTLTSYVGQAVAVLHSQEGTTPEHIYALFLPAVVKLAPDSGTPDWTASLWQKIGNFWSAEESKVEAVRQEEQERQSRASNLCMSLTDGVRQWCGDLPAAKSEASLLEWIKGHSIVSVGNSYHVMRQDGYYDSLPLGTHQVIARVRTLGMDGVIETQVPRDDGKGFKDIPISSIIGKHATVAKEVVAMPCLPGATLLEPDTDRATFKFCCFDRNPHLEPRFDEDVDRWLNVFFGDALPTALDWIGHALAFDEGPICTLSIVAEPGTGKKMFFQGLAECLARPALATANDLVSNFQYGLLESPFLVVNEGWPSTNYGRHPADTFREYVGGDPIKVNRKFAAPVSVHNCIRGIMTANNLSVVRMLAERRDLSSKDRAALTVRLLHLNLPDKAANWLTLQGGLQFTARPGRRWIRGDGNQPSDFIVARHFLWLYRNRRPSRGGRLLVEGNASLADFASESRPVSMYTSIIQNGKILPPLTRSPLPVPGSVPQNAAEIIEGANIEFELRTQTNGAPLVAETIIQMLESGRKFSGLVITKNHELFVSAAQVLEYYRDNMAATVRERLNSRQVGSVLSGLSKQDHPHAMILEDAPTAGRRRWHEIDCDNLLLFAQRDGWKHGKLEELVNKQKAFMAARKQRLAEVVETPTEATPEATPETTPETPNNFPQNSPTGT